MTQTALDAGVIRTEIEDGIGWFIIDHAARENAISLAMMRTMPDLLAQLDNDPDVRVLVIRGAGDRSFSAGGDISEFKHHQNAGTSEAWAREVNQEMIGSWTRVGKPVLAMIHGFCMGGGLVVALYADIRIASDKALFSLPPAKLGTGYPYNLVKLAVNCVGPASAAEMLFSGSTYDAKRALEMGLVNRVVAPADLEAETRKLAKAIASNAPLTVAAAKRAILEIMNDPGQSEHEEVGRMVSACLRSEDFREGARAFMEKRRPVFRGR